MKSPHLLRAANNVRQLKENLVTVLDPRAIDAIETEILANVGQLYSLGRAHFLFAERQNSRAWRQKISRLYYAAYNVSRAVRLCASGEFSTDSSDHRKIEELPVDFPKINTYKNKLGLLREDRNLCDYDHTGKLKDLIASLDESLNLVRDFLHDAQAYLKGRGVTL